MDKNVRVTGKEPKQRPPPILSRILQQSQLSQAVRWVDCVNRYPELAPPLVTSMENSTRHYEAKVPNNQANAKPLKILGKHFHRPASGLTNPQPRSVIAFILKLRKSKTSSSAARSAGLRGSVMRQNPYPSIFSRVRPQISTPPLFSLCRLDSSCTRCNSPLPSLPLALPLPSTSLHLWHA